MKTEYMLVVMDSETGQMVPRLVSDSEERLIIIAKLVHSFFPIVYRVESVPRV